MPLHVHAFVYFTMKDKKGLVFSRQIIKYSVHNLCLIIVAGDKNISILHLSCRMSELKIYALVL